MTLTQLEYILAVSDTGSFSQAALKCHVTQPTLSMQIQKLEETLGVVLFDRTKQPVRATSLGQLVLNQARLVIKDSERIKELVSENKGELRGEVRLGIIPTLAPYLLPLFLKKMITTHPDLRIRIEELETHIILEKLRNNTLDLGLAVSPIDDINIAVHALFYEPFLVYTSKAHPLASQKHVAEKDLSLTDVLLLNEGHCFREQSLSLCRKKVGPDSKVGFTFESGSLETLKKIIDQGTGFTLLPWLAAQDVKDKKRLKTFLNPIPTREVSLLHGPHFQRKALLKAFIEDIQSGLPEDLTTKKTAHQKAISPLT